MLKACVTRLPGCSCGALAYIVACSSQVVMATAQVLFQRFWFVTSLKHFGIRVRLACCRSPLSVCAS